MTPSQIWFRVNPVFENSEAGPKSLHFLDVFLYNTYSFSKDRDDRIMMLRGPGDWPSRGPRVALAIPTCRSAPQGAVHAHTRVLRAGWLSKSMWDQRRRGPRRSSGSNCEVPPWGPAVGRHRTQAASTPRRHPPLACGLPCLPSVVGGGSQACVGLSYSRPETYVCDSNIKKDTANCHRVASL